MAKYKISDLFDIIIKQITKQWLENAVINCQEDYTTDNQVKAFWLPKDLKERKLWFSVIPRDNMPYYKDTMVCEEHWPADYSEVIYYGKERPREYHSSYNKLVCQLAWLLKLKRH